MIKQIINNNIIMLTIALVLFLVVIFLGGMNIVRADEAVEYDKSFISIEIEKGDTLSSIAQEYAKSEADYEDYINEVKNINSIKDDTIHSGCYLMVPVYTVVE